MLSDTERKELFKKLNNGKNEISRLREELNNLNEQKEAWFRKKSEVGKKIADLIRQSKSSKSKRNEFTQQVKNLKTERNQFSDKIKAKISELKGMKAERDALISKLKSKENPRELKSEIKKLEYKMETEVMSFDKERQLMKKIKELKKRYEGFAEIMKVDEKARKLSREIDDEKRKELELHRKVQNIAKESQAKHEEMVGSSSVIEQLRTEEKEHEVKFLEARKAFSEKNEELKQKLFALKDIGGKVGEHIGEEREERRKKQRGDIDSRKSAVKEKMKKGGKLTTEDILLMQHGQDDEE